MTVQELAKLAKVSPATISLVLNNKKGVSDETRKRVQALIKKHNYSPPVKSRVPLKNIRFLKYKDHGMIVDGNGDFITSIMDAIETEARNFGYNMSITTADGNFEDAIATVAAESSDGIIILGTEIPPESYHLLDSIRTPFVIVDNIMQGSQHDCILMNNCETILHALSYLHGLGHREIAYARSSVRISNFDERQEAFGKYCKLLGFSCQSKHIFEVAPTLEGAYHSMQELLRQDLSLPTCLFAENDSIAIGIIKALKETGLKIPDDISIMGFDDIQYSRINNPALTTMRIPRRTIGTMAVQRLRQRMKDPRSYDVKIKVGAKLMARKSTAPPKKK
ncbi:LacI family DNA-binding transcriptional regulator [Christensenellaceae bacterium OttesenSCG-928-K19]|nr:LacI family DNA-binding transcriptional regulator [Christensenellaceae bacterium OttesenSCG-928-K19]